MLDPSDRDLAEATAAVVAGLVAASAESPSNWLAETAKRLRDEVHRLQARNGGGTGVWVRMALAHATVHMGDADICGLAVAPPIDGAHTELNDAGGGLPF